MTPLMETWEGVGQPSEKGKVGGACKRACTSTRERNRTAIDILTDASLTCSFRLSLCVWCPWSCGTLVSSPTWGFVNYILSFMGPPPFPRDCTCASIINWPGGIRRPLRPPHGRLRLVPTLADHLPTLCTRSDRVAR